MYKFSGPGARPDCEEFMEYNLAETPIWVMLDQGQGLNLIEIDQ
jgi:hypothetical protein